MEKGKWPRGRDDPEWLKIYIPADYVAQAQDIEDNPDADHNRPAVTDLDWCLLKIRVRRDSAQRHLDYFQAVGGEPEAEAYYAGALRYLNPIYDQLVGVREFKEKAAAEAEKKEE